MRDAQRIDPTLDLVREVWAMYPDWRLGQLLSNAMRAAVDGHLVDEFALLRGIEDDKLRIGLRRLGMDAIREAQ